MLKQKIIYKISDQHYSGQLRIPIQWSTDRKKEQSTDTGYNVEEP